MKGPYGTWATPELYVVGAHIGRPKVVNDNCTWFLLETSDELQRAVCRGWGLWEVIGDWGQEEEEGSTDDCYNQILPVRGEGR